MGAGSVDVTRGGPGDLPCVKLTHPSGASALVYIYAAHLASWRTASGEEQLFVSSASAYGGGKAIRGGVPICWPQFNERGPYKRHGIVRTSDAWEVVRTSTDPFPCVVLGLADSEATRAEFPSAFRLQYSVTLDGPESVSTALTVINPSDEPLQFTTALHTYFACSDVLAARVRGLQGVGYIDSANGGAEATQEEEETAVTGEIDRLYLGAPSETYIVDGDRAIKLLKMGFADAVVWNIGETKGAEMKVGLTATYFDLLRHLLTSTYFGETKGAEMKVAWPLTYCDLLRSSYTYYSLTAQFLHVL